MLPYIDILGICYKKSIYLIRIARCFKQMRNIFISLAVITFIFGCKPESKQRKIELSDLNLYLETDLEIDCVFVSNITQDREYQYIPYSDTLRINFNDSINDLYNISFITKERKIMNTLWLNGESLIVKGIITNKLKIDTVIGSDLYYKSIDFRKKYKELDEKKSDSATINDFLLNELKKNVENPFSIEIADKLFYRNISKRNELKKVYDILVNQEDAIKNHLINPYRKIEKMLTDDKVDLSKFLFYDTEKKLTTIKPKKGKKILIDFWFIACAPCIKDHQLIVNKLEWIKSNNIELIGISIDKNHEEWKEYLKEKNYNWLNLRELNLPEKMLRTNMLISAFPTYLLIDSDGNILYRANSFNEIEKHLNM